MGLQLISRIRDTFAVEIPLAALFEAPTIAVLPSSSTKPSSWSWTR